MVSGRSLNDIDLIFAPDVFRAVAGHGAEMRLSVGNEADDVHAPPMDKELKRRLAAIAKLSPGILLEDKGYSLALHYRLAPHAEKAIFEAVSLIRADLPNAPIEVLPGKFVCEIKHSGFTKATGVRELMKHEPFKGRRPIFIGDDVTDETVFAIMPDMNGLSFSVGRRAIGVNGHFDAPKMCARSSRVCSTTQGWNKAPTPRGHIVARVVRLRAQFMLGNTVTKTDFVERNRRVPSRKTGSNACARFWFHFVQMMDRNHIDEQQLNGLE